jgi:hypothetical protein
VLPREIIRCEPRIQHRDDAWIWSTVLEPDDAKLSEFAHLKHGIEPVIGDNLYGIHIPASVLALRRELVSSSATRSSELACAEESTNSTRVFLCKS